MRRNLAVTVAVTLICGVAGLGQQPSKPAPATFCQLYEQPDAFEGKMVIMKAELGGDWKTGKERLIGSTDWGCLQDGAMWQRTIFLTRPEDINSATDGSAADKPCTSRKAQFELVNDDEYKRLMSLASTEEVAIGNTRVIACFTGRIDHCRGFKFDAYANVANGFGRAGMSEFQLVLESVSDVATAPPIDYDLYFKSADPTPFPTECRAVSSTRKPGPQ